MKKLLLFISCFLILGCETRDTSVYVYRTETSNETVVIDQTPYRKVKVEGHDFYFRRWSAASDLVHNPNCKKCLKRSNDKELKK